MGAALRFTGRLLFVTLLLSSAVLKINQPNGYTNQVSTGYNSVRDLHGSLKDVLPSVGAHIPLPTVVRIIGVVQGLISLLIVFGDRLGGVLLFVYLVVYGLANYANTIFSAIAKQRLADLQTILPQLTIFVSLLGFSIVFMSRRGHRKAPIKV